MTQRRSRFDAELAASLSVIGGVFPPTITPSLIDFMRVSYASEPLAETLSGRRVEHSIRCPATSVRTSRYPSSDDPVTPADDLRSSTPIPVD